VIRKHHRANQNNKDDDDLEISDDDEQEEGVGYPLDSDHGSYLSDESEDNDEQATETHDYDDEDEASTKTSKGRFALFRRKPTGPATDELQGQIAQLDEKFRQAVHDKEAMEKLYETTSWQLKEAQTEMKALKQTTSYLQTQVRDQEELMERVKTTEQNKSQEELARMKEAMVKVIKRERENMRKEFLKQANELQTMWREERDSKAPSYPWKRKNNQQQGPSGGGPNGRPMGPRRPVPRNNNNNNRPR
jgi:hypothetical protein